MAAAAKVVTVQGEAFARSANGIMRRLAAGDSIEQGEVVITSVGGAAELRTVDGQMMSINSQESFQFGAESTQATAPGAGEAALAAGAPAPTVVQPGELTPEQLLEQEAAAAGLGGGGENGGNSFVRLMRISEELTPLSYEFADPAGAGLLPTPDQNGPNNDVPTAGDLVINLDEDDISTGDISTAWIGTFQASFAAGTNFDALYDGGNNDTADGDHVPQSSPTTLSGHLNFDYGNDGVGGLVFNLPTAALTSGPDDLPLSYWMSPDGHTLVGYVVETGGVPTVKVIFSAEITDVATGGFSFTLYGPLDHLDNTTEDNLIVPFSFTVTDSDGDSAIGTLTLNLDDDSPVLLGGTNEGGDGEYGNVVTGTIYGTAYLNQGQGESSNSENQPTSTVDGWFFTVNSEGTVTIDTRSMEPDGQDVNGDGEIAYFDPYIYVYTNDNGVPGTLIASNDDSGQTYGDGSVHGFDSFLSLNLAAGDYILKIGAYYMSDEEARSGVNEDSYYPVGEDGPIDHGDYQITFGGDVTVTAGPGTYDEPGDTFVAEEDDLNNILAVGYNEDESEDAHIVTGTIEDDVAWGADGFGGVTGFKVDGESGEFQPGQTVYWGQDGAFLGTAVSDGKSGLMAPEGAAAVLTVDSNGEYRFEMLDNLLIGNEDDPIEQIDFLAKVMVTGVDGDGDPVDVPLNISVQDDMPVIYEDSYGEEQAQVIHDESVGNQGMQGMGSIMPAVFSVGPEQHDWDQDANDLFTYLVPQGKGYGPELVGLAANSLGPVSYIAGADGLRNVALTNSDGGAFHGEDSGLFTTTGSLPIYLYSLSEFPQLAELLGNKADNLVVGLTLNPEKLEALINDLDAQVPTITNEDDEASPNEQLMDSVAFVVGIDEGSTDESSDDTFGVLQLKAIKHPDTKDHDDPRTLDQIHLTVTDNDGDTVTTQSALLVSFEDDGPRANVAEVMTDTLVLDETRKVGSETDGDSEPAGLRTFTADFSDNFQEPDYGTDGPGSVAYKLVLSSESEEDIGSGLYALGENGGQGEEIMLTQQGDKITGAIGEDKYFTIEVNGETGEVTFTQKANVWHADTESDDDTSTLTLGEGDSLRIVQVVTDADGDKDRARIELGNGIFQIEDDGPRANNDEGVSSASTPATGFLMTNDEVGTDAPGHIVTVNDQAPNEAGSIVVNGDYGTLSVNAVTGEYTYTQTATNVATITVTDDNADSAGYHNTFGYYIKGDNGQPVSGEIIWTNMHDAHPNAFVLAGVDPAKVGWFLIPNGDGSTSNTNNTTFVDGADVTFALNGTGQWMVQIGGTTLANPNGQTLFNDNVLNVGTEAQKWGYLIDNEVSGNLNWEDLKGGGDYDNNDVNLGVTVALTPADNDTFTYVMEDADGDTSQATLTINPNIAPYAGWSGAWTNEDTPITIAPSTLLGLAQDADGDVLTLVNVEFRNDAKGATLVQNLDGSWTMVPAADFNGYVDLKYTVSDGENESSGVYTVDVRPMAETPVPVDSLNLILNTSDDNVVPEWAFLATVNPDLDITGTNDRTGAHLTKAEAQPDGDITVKLTGQTFTGHFDYVANNNSENTEVRVNVSKDSSDSTNTVTNGTSGNDIIFDGSSGTHSAFGGEGDDVLIGNAGDDTLGGGKGNDFLEGGSGEDTFVWKLADVGIAGAPAKDVVTDFNISDGDKLDLSEVLGTHEGRTLELGATSSADGKLVLQVTEGADVVQEITLSNIAVGTSGGADDPATILNTLKSHIDGA